MRARCKKSISFLLIVSLLTLFSATPVLAASQISTNGVLNNNSFTQKELNVPSNATYTVTLSSTRLEGSGNFYVSFYKVDGSQTIFRQKVLNNTVFQKRYTLTAGNWILMLSTDSSSFGYAANIYKTF